MTAHTLKTKNAAASLDTGNLLVLIGRLRMHTSVVVEAEDPVEALYHVLDTEYPGRVKPQMGKEPGGMSVYKYIYCEDIDNYKRKCCQAQSWEIQLDDGQENLIVSAELEDAEAPAGVPTMYVVTPDGTLEPSNPAQ
ncbi:MAG: hypothetical protein AAF682_01665 [Planctomycetota bacterium]